MVDKAQKTQGTSSLHETNYALSGVGDYSKSICGDRIRLIERKRTFADAAVDGVIPSGAVLTPAKVMKDLQQWLGRLRTQGAAEIGEAAE